jgi:hypothetical protein
MEPTALNRNVGGQRGAFTVEFNYECRDIYWLPKTAFRGQTAFKATVACVYNKVHALIIFAVSPSVVNVAV